MDQRRAALISNYLRDNDERSKSGLIHDSGTASYTPIQRLYRVRLRVCATVCVFVRARVCVDDSLGLKSN